MYLQYHRGCYTTQSETKKLIRYNEELLQNAEKFASLSFLTAKRPYDNGAFEEIWKRVLFDHFHDIMPGSGIGINYVDADRNLTNASLRSQKILDDSLDLLGGEHRNQRGRDSGGGVQFAIVGAHRRRSLSKYRRAARGAAVGRPRFGRAAAAFASRLPPIRRRSALHAAGDGRKTCHRWVTKVIHVVPAPQSARRRFLAEGEWNFDLENEFMRVKIDPQTGCVTSLVNKADGKRQLLPAAAAICSRRSRTCRARRTPGKSGSTRKVWDLKQPKEVKLVESGPERAVVRIRQTFKAPTRAEGQKSTFSRDVIVYAGVPRVDVETGGELARAARSAQGGLPGQRARRQSDVRDSLRHYPAAHHAQYAGRKSHVRSARDAVGRYFELPPRASAC